MEFGFVGFEEVPATLYHYTSIVALISIVRTRSLWASNIRFLNDRTEAQRLRESVVNLLHNRDSTPDEKSLVDAIVHALGVDPKRSDFVASLSEKGDLLSQWRAYCPPGLGVSVGFDSKALQEQWIANPNGGDPFFLSAPFQKVRYYAPVHERALKDTVEHLLALELEGRSGPPGPNIDVMASVILGPLLGAKPLSSDLRALTEKMLATVIEVEGKTLADYHWPPGSSLVAWIIQLAPFFKHDAFQEECEWRKVVSKDSRLMPGQRFRSGKSTLIPFVEVMLDKVTVDARCVPRTEYFIKEVIIGPTPTPELSLEALQMLFATEGHAEVGIRQSKVPYRSW